MKTRLLKLALFAVASVLPLGASAETEDVAIGQAILSYNLEAVAKTTDITAIDPITADGTVYSHFSTQQLNCF